MCFLIVGMMCIQYLQLFVKGLPPELTMDDVRELFSRHGKVMKVIFDISLPGRAWIVSCLI